MDCVRTHIHHLTSAALSGRCARVASSAIAAIIIARWTFKRFRRAQRVKYLEGLAEKARREREDSIEWARKTMEGTPKEERDSIGTMDYQQIREALQYGSLSATAVLHSFLSRALDAHAITNCVTLFIRESSEWASEWDEKAKDPAFDKPFFFGIPFSIKDSLMVKGYSDSRGLASRLENTASTDSYFVEIAKKNGGIPFVVTNVPTGLMAYESNNCIFGQTCHPLSKDRTTGGSSGGEAALIAGGGSIIGFGSDLGGSVRIPAAYGGCSGFRPTSQRHSYYPMGHPIPGRPFVWPTDGVLATNMQACADFLRYAAEDNFMHEKDWNVPPVQWRKELFEKGSKYKIGYFVSDDYLAPVPAMERAVIKAKKLLESKGHTLVPFRPVGFDQTIPLLYAALFIDGGIGLSMMFEEDLYPKDFEQFKQDLATPAWRNRLKSSVFNLLGIMKHSVYASKVPQTTAEVQGLIFEVIAYRDAVMESMKREGIQALLCPPTLSPALRHGEPVTLSLNTINLTMVFNMLDFAAGVSKIAEWSEEDARSLSDYPSNNWYQRTIKESCKTVLFESLRKGMPIGVQVAAPTYRDEVALRILCDLEDGRDGRE